MFQVYSNLRLFYNNIRIILEVHLSFKFKLEKEKLAIQTEETSLKDIWHYLCIIKRKLPPPNPVNLKIIAHYVRKINK